MELEFSLVSYEIRSMFFETIVQLYLKYGVSIKFFKTSWRKEEEEWFLRAHFLWSLQSV